MSSIAAASATGSVVCRILQGLAITAVLALPARATAAAATQSAAPCAALTRLGLPEATVTLAQLVRPGQFRIPAPVQAPGPGLGVGARDGNVFCTHPLCAYPKAARYMGSGDVNDAANFARVGR